MNFSVLKTLALQQKPNKISYVTPQIKLKFIIVQVGESSGS